MPKIVDHPARRLHISAIAADLIAEGGMEAATIREIASRSGFSKGVIEHYFENKGELIASALEWINQQLGLRVEKATAGLVGLEALRKRIGATLPMNRTVRNEWKVRLVFWSAAGVQNELRQQQARRFDRTVGFYEDNIADAIQNGDIEQGSDAAVLSRRLFTAAIGISTLALYNPRRYNKAFLAREIEHLIEGLTGKVNPAAL